MLVVAVTLGLSVFAQERQKFVYAKSILGQKAPELVVELSCILLIKPQGILCLEDLSRNVTPEMIYEIIEKYK